MGHSLSRQKDIYDQRAHGKPFMIGNLVWLHCPSVPRGKSKKLHRPWSGPFRIVSQLSEVTYRIQHTRARRQRIVVHFDCLKRCPHNIRLPSDVPTTSHSTSSTPRAPPDILGSNLELVDDPEDIPSQPPHRYPSRQRRPPDYFGAYVSH